jgi:hypothetical protein
MTSIGQRILELADTAESATRIAYGIMASATTVNIEGNTTAIASEQLASAGTLVTGDYVAMLVAGGDNVVVGSIGTGGPDKICVLYSATATLTTSLASVESSWTASSDAESWEDGTGITPTIAGWYQVEANLYADIARDGEWYIRIQRGGAFYSPFIYRDDSAALRRVGAGVSGLVYCDGAQKLELFGTQTFTTSSDLNCTATLSAQLVYRA